MPLRRVLVTVFAVGLVLTACGRGDDDDDAASPGPADTETSPAPPAAPVPGVTDEACPDAVNPDNGCIYLGIISDLTDGPFAALAVPVTAGMTAFWNKVNEDGGIGGYDIDVATFVGDSHYNPQTHNEVYQGMKDDIFALAQSLGTPTTQAILDDLKAENIVAVPATWWSQWDFDDVILESGASYCIESMNAVDYAVETYSVESAMAVGFPTDYGGDAAAGTQIAAEANGLTYTSQPTGTGAENQADAIAAILQNQPDLVILTTGPAEAAAIVGLTAAQGFTGRFIGTSPTWNPALLASDSAGALTGLYEQSGPWGTWGTESAGHAAMREAIGDVDVINDGYTSGWVWSYPMKAALEAAVAADNLTREGLVEAVQSLTTVDYEGMLPPEAGNYGSDANAAAFRGTVISKVDAAAPTGVSTVRDFFVGPTAESYDYAAACFAG